jgi:hypothetical protein
MPGADGAGPPIACTLLLAAASAALPARGADLAIGGISREGSFCDSATTVGSGRDLPCASSQPVNRPIAHEGAGRLFGGSPVVLDVALRDWSPHESTGSWDFDLL